MPANVLRKNPGADVRVETGINQPLSIDSVAGKNSQPTTVDLHVTEIFAAVPVQIPRLRISAGLDGRDGFEQRWSNAIACPSLFKTMGVARKRKQQKVCCDQNAIHGRHGREASGTCAAEM